MGWDVKEMDRLFNPRSLAVVGAKGPGYNWISNSRTFKGPLYSVQIDEKEIPGIEALGVPNYKSLKEIPGPVDYVIVSVPRSVAPIVLKDAIEKGVDGVMFFTAGLAETGTEEGVRIQKLLTEMAQKARLKVVGPNCMGIYNPRVGLRQNGEQVTGEEAVGPMGFISQSGTHANAFSEIGGVNGIKISKSVSIGNAIVLDSTDYLEYLGQDEETKLIGMYVEGVKDGRRFFQVLREVCSRKPVIIWKGGQTPQGSRAVASHTASLAGSMQVWDALIRQCGAVKVNSIDEMVDTAKAFIYIKPTTGKRMGLVAMTGGQSVVVSDTFAKEGLEVPALTQKSYDQYEGFFSLIGGSYRNPLDMTPNSGSPDLIRRILDILGSDENVDAVMYEMRQSMMGRRDFFPAIMDSLVDFRNTLPKPYFMVVTAGAREGEGAEMRKNLAERGIASYPNFQRAAAAFRHLVEYSVFRQEIAAEA